MNILWPSFLTSKVLVQAIHALNGNAFNLNLELLNFGVGWVTDTPDWNISWLLSLLQNSLGNYHETVCNCISCMMFVQGYHCSRCMYTMHCRGCRVAPEGELLLQTGDTLAVRFSEPVDHTDLAVEHPSMKLMRHQDPLSLYDCLQAFSERFVFGSKIRFFHSVKINS